MKQIKVVIGANYGDEGKGMMTDYFASQAAKNQEKCIVVCSNGGSQRGHTVVTPEGIRHIFHHFGSGSFVLADTYLSEEYIVNPLVFRKEYEELERYGIAPSVYVHASCRWSTPFDMFINQIVEEARGSKRHGSCGYGIWETMVRSEKISWRLGSLSTMSDQKIEQILKQIRNEYLPERLWELGVDRISREWEDIIGSEGLIERFVQDIRFFLEHTTFAGDENLTKYDSIIFENGQGLLLDQNILEHNEHTTPSNTGLANPKKIIENVFKKDEAEVEVCYITRTYLTRHGAGPLPCECEKSEINPDMVDKTNVPNPHQGTLRYAPLNKEELKARIQKDFGENEGWKLSLALTHRNEYEMNIEREKFFDQIYASAGEERSSVKVLELC